jgi:hypothetical protein
VPPPWLQVREVWNRFGATEEEGMNRYREYLRVGLVESTPAPPISGIVIGDDATASRVLGASKIRAQSAEIPRLERTAPPPLVAIFARAIDTDAAIRQAYNAGHELKAIARHIGAHYSTVSLIARRANPRQRPSRIALRATDNERRPNQ